MRVAGALLIIAAAMAIAASGEVPGPADIVEGNPSSPVKVQIYEDLQCSDCARLRTLLDDRILPKYGSKVAFIHRDFPLPTHEWARPAALAGRWVYEHDPKLGIVFRRELLAERVNITAANLKPWLLEFAARNNLDQKGILDSLNDTRLGALTDRGELMGEARGVTKIPTVYIGGVKLVEIILYEDLARALDDALGK